jgi:hypothetical protein
MTEEYHDEKKSSAQSHGEPHARKTMDKIWDATVDTWQQTAFRAGKYSRVVQKKIDLSSVHKKIGTGHADLGKIIDDLYQTGKQEVMSHTEVRQLLDTLTALRALAASLEEEIAAIRSEELPEEQPHDNEGGNA